MRKTILPTTRLFLIRHGETLANREFRYIGARDDALSSTGESQATQLGSALATLPVAAIYSSPLQRAYRTAEAIARPHQLTVQVTPELRECNFGAWEGLSRAEVLAQDAARLYAWERDTTVAPPDGESFAAMQQRVRTFVEQLAETQAGQALALVSHVGPIKVLLAAALDAPLSSSLRIFLDPATISVVDWQPGDRALVRLVNSHAHMGWTEARWMR
ncbi:MAG TPA: histidine phosphatase family protein [Ktedonobacteraceae bacterium]|nr:histidine phosphatase family protein [Ktedonobacteraceae bacterium]